MDSTDCVLLLDNDQHSVYILGKVFRHCGIPSPLYVVRYLDEAVLYLEGVGVYANRKKYPMPCVVLIDLLDPRSRGFDLLRWIRNRPELERLPIIVLINADSDEKIQQALDSGANAYLLKSAGAVEMAGTLKGLDFIGKLLSFTPTSSQIDIQQHRIAPDNACASIRKRSVVAKKANKAG